MLKIQKILTFVVVIVIFASCSEYQEVLNKGTAEEQYKAATQLFEEGKYNKAIALFEKVIPSYGRKPQMERIQYMVAMSNYNTKSYELAAYYFNRFISNYPNSSKIEEATFLTALCYYLDTPKFSRDQKDTQTALQSLQNFIDKYPNSDKIEEANKYFKDLTFRLEKKSFEVAKQYYHIEDYKAAIVAFDNFVSEHVGSPLKEDAYYYRFKAANDLAVNSILAKKEERLENAIASHAKFKKNFPDSDRMKELDKMLANLNKELESTKKLIQKLNENIITSNGL